MSRCITDFAQATADLAEMTARKDGAYLERNRCVALIARMALASGWRAGIARTVIEVWTPTGVRLEHQVVMEQTLGRPLVPGEVVHHIDGDKANNEPTNLHLTTQSEHIREHLADMHAARYGR
jgi:hypothetical protein